MPRFDIRWANSSAGTDQEWAIRVADGDPVDFELAAGGASSSTVVVVADTTIQVAVITSVDSLVATVSLFYSAVANDWFLTANPTPNEWALHDVGGPDFTLFCKLEDELVGTGNPGGPAPPFSPV